MATQRITIAKLGGVAADVVWRRLQRLASVRKSADPHEWSSSQWPVRVHRELNDFVDALRANSLFPPVIYFVEWSDLWSMGDVLLGALMPPSGLSPIQIHSDRFEVYAYALPDAGQLLRHLSKASPQRFDERIQYETRLREAVHAWHAIVEQAVLIVVREVIGGLFTDDELRASLSVMPQWIEKLGD